MKTSSQFVAELLETGAAGFAGLAASLLHEDHPDLIERFSPNGFGKWKAQLQQWLLDLSAAIDAEEPALFAERIRWNRTAFATHKVPADDLHTALAALREALHENLPDEHAQLAVAVVDRALADLQESDAAPIASGLDPSRSSDQRALAYLKTILEGDPRAAIAEVLATADNPDAVRDAYLNVVIPAQAEAGRMWHAGEISIAEEHIISSTTQRAMTLLCERAQPKKRLDATVVLACVAGNIHDLAMNAVADFFDMAGWKTLNLGADVPDEEIARAIRFFNADVTVLSATLAPHLRTLHRALTKIRSLVDDDVKMIVGGHAFDAAPNLWQKFGADGYSPTIEDTEPLARRLLG